MAVRTALVNRQKEREVEETKICTLCGRQQPALNNFCTSCGAPKLGAGEKEALPGTKFLTGKEMLGAALIVVCSVAFLLVPLWVPNLSNEQADLIQMFQIIIFVICPILGFIGYGLFVMARGLIREWKIKKAIAAGLCTKCRTPNFTGARFCMKCGTALGRDPALAKTHIDEVMITIGAIVFYLFLAAGLSAFTRFGNGDYFLIGVAPVLFLSAQLYVSTIRGQNATGFCAC